MKYIHTQTKTYGENMSHDYRQTHNYLDKQKDICLGKRLKNT